MFHEESVKGKEIKDHEGKVIQWSTLEKVSSEAQQIAVAR